MRVASSATLIRGEQDAVLVDTFRTREHPLRLAEAIADAGKHLTNIYIARGHGDHVFASNVLKARFPHARPVATPSVVERCDAARRWASPPANRSRRSFWAFAACRRRAVIDAQERGESEVSDGSPVGLRGCHWVWTSASPDAIRGHLAQAWYSAKGGERNGTSAP
jgi:glyoxylase-like metal-dependent hydrolase (beta-lactamase superfamily II)